MATDYFVYKTMAGDTWDILALDAYNDEMKASLLIQANPQYADIIVFPAGIELKIPIVDDAAPDTLPPWKR
ncbi:MAG: tail protein X [Peptococcaceae bacterium]|jgi:phage tail protein X|nr:tail protein X [Peptococcaceae bacterium]MDH7525291.1 tail protein X [Peptococcaceae bacterium]